MAARVYLQLSGCRFSRGNGRVRQADPRASCHPRRGVCLDRALDGDADLLTPRRSSHTHRRPYWVDCVPTLILHRAYDPCAPLEAVRIMAHQIRRDILGVEA
jgi:pimeloyl-ACP methyl ester carboxylesterase